MSLFCKHCNCELNDLNISKNGKNKVRNECKPCRSKIVVEYHKNNAQKRRIYINNYVRKIGKVKQYPCIQCEKLCFKKYEKAVCSDECRFLSYVNVTDECWIWIGGRNRRGYGKFHWKNKLMVASRVSYEMFKGIIPENKLVCHTCDNPPCVKPVHLWIGTNSENQQDSIKKGRHFKSKKLRL